VLRPRRRTRGLATCWWRRASSTRRSRAAGIASPFVSANSQHRQHRQHECCLFSDLRKDGLIASRPITAGSTDGADVIFSTTRAHLDHSGPCAAFTRECDLDAQRPEGCLRPPQPTSQRPRIFCPCCGPRDVIAALSAHKRKRSDALPLHVVRSTMIARTQVAMGSAMAVLRFAA
jgi:hypothetical protein